MNHVSRREFAARMALLALSSTGLPAYAKTRQENRFTVGAFVTSLIGASSRDTEIGVSLMLEEVANELGWIIDVEMYDDVERYQADLYAGAVDLAVGSPSQLLSVYDEISPEKLFLFHLHNKSTRRFAILVSKRSGKTDIASLKGSRLLVPRGTDIGGIFLEAELSRNSLGAVRDHFADVNLVENYDDAISRVFFGQADAALVTRTAYELAGELNPQIPENTRIVAESLELITAMTFPVAMPAAQIEPFSAMMLSMHERPRGRSLLKLFGCDSLVVGNATQLEPVRELLRLARDISAD